jgi:putative membrane protein insertion efficiency factor
VNTARPFILLIRLYQWTLGWILGTRCRFLPSCSEYGVEALQKYGALRGAWFIVRRLGRCHPFCAGGHDPLP